MKPHFIEKEGSDKDVEETKTVLENSSLHTRNASAKALRRCTPGAFQEQQGGW